MNNKLNEYRDYYTEKQDSAVKQSAFKEGFNKAIELNLFEKFTEWSGNNNAQIIVEKLEKENPELEDEDFINLVYKHWLENIFTPEYN